MWVYAACSVKTNYVTAVNLRKEYSDVIIAPSHQPVKISDLADINSALKRVILVIPKHDSRSVLSFHMTRENIHDSLIIPSGNKPMNSWNEWGRHYRAYARTFHRCLLSPHVILCRPVIFKLKSRIWFVWFSWIFALSLIHIWRCRRYSLCRSRWSPYH